MSTLNLQTLSKRECSGGFCILCVTIHLENLDFLVACKTEMDDTGVHIESKGLKLLNSEDYYHKNALN